jgi:hypothetical protein
VKHDECNRTRGASTFAKVSHDDRDRLVSRLVLNSVADDPAWPVACRQIGLGDPAHQLLAQAAVFDQGLDRDDRQPVLAADRMQPITAGDAGAIEDLAEDSRRRQSSHPYQVDRRFGMASPSEHAPLLGDQGKEMARPGQILRHGCGINDGSNRPRPLFGTDAGVTRSMVHGNRVRGLVRGRIPIHHRGKMKPGRDLRQDRHAYKPASVRDHKLDHFGRNLVGGRDKIPLVFAVFVVNDDDDPPFPQCLEGVVNLREFIVHGQFLTSKRRYCIELHSTQSGNSRRGPP